MDQTSLLAKSAALCSSLILAGGYVAFRSGLLQEPGIGTSRLPLAEIRSRLDQDSSIDRSDSDDFNLDDRGSGLSEQLASTTSTPPIVSPLSPVFQSPAIVETGRVDANGVFDETLQARLDRSGGAQPQITVLSGSKSVVLQFEQQPAISTSPLPSGTLIPVTSMTAAVSTVAPSPRSGFSFTPMAGSKSAVILTRNDLRTPRDFAVDFFNRNDKDKNGILSKDELPPYVWKYLESINAISEDYVNWRVFEENYAEFDKWLFRQK